MQADLWGCGAIGGLFGEAPVYGDIESCADCYACADAEEGEAGDTGGPPAASLVDVRVAREEEVEGSVDGGDPCGEEEDDGFGECENPRACECCFEGGPGVYGSVFDVEEGDVVFSGLLREFCGAPVEEDWAVGFGDEEDGEEEADGGEDCVKAEDPAPACCCTEEAAGYWA